MKVRIIVAFALLAVLVSPAPSVQAVQMDVKTAVGDARAVLTAQHFSRDEISKVLVEALEAAIPILPRTAEAADSASRLTSVAAAMKGGGLFSDKNREDISLVYKRIGGQAWEVPKEILNAPQPKDGIKLATEICLKLVDSALAEWTAGRGGKAAANLLSFVMLVITPIEAK